MARDRKRLAIPETWFRAPMVVLSDRRPAPGEPRTGLELALEGELRQYDGVWLAHHADPPDAWSVLDPASPPSADRWTEYVHANAEYAERIIESLRPGGTVWIHGQRWLLVAPELRRHGHRGPIGLLLDVPFPAPARLEALPWHAEVVTAMCELNLAGFRTPECAGHFEACCARAGRRRPPIEVFPEADGPVLLHRLASAEPGEPRRGLAG
jgi:hypothetical protein